MLCNNCSADDMKPVHTLSDEEIKHLQNITFNGLLRTKTPPEVEVKLLQHGFIRRATGGLMPTNVAHQAIIDWDGDQ